jgi:hypothetical protein
MWPLIYTAIATVAVLIFPSIVKPATSPTTGETSGTPNDSLLSQANLEYVSLLAGIIASVGTIYLLSRGKGD